MTIPFEYTMPDGSPLLLMMPNGVESKSAQLTRDGTVLETVQGARVVRAGKAIARETFPLQFVSEDRAQRNFLEDFFEARRGRYETFWCPSWQWDLDLRGYQSPYLWVRGFGYENFFNASTSYRKFAILYADEFSVHTITAVTPAVAPGVDLLTFSTHHAGAPEMGAGPNLINEAFRPLWLRRVRFASDKIEAKDLNDDGAAVFDVQLEELNDEEPV